MKLVELRTISRVRHGRALAQLETGKVYSVMRFEDIPNSGFLLHTKETIIALETQIDLTLKSYDILIPLLHIKHKIAIIGKTENQILASSAFVIIRLNDYDISIEQQAIALYMYFKSEKGQNSLSMLFTQSTANRRSQIRVSDLRKLLVPLYSDEERIQQIEKFYQENKLYQEIAEIKSKIKILHML